MANIITCVRIACALPLIVFPTFSKWFYLFYLLAGASDVLDGFTARHLGKETKLGARLDTIADIVFTVTVLIKIMLSVRVPVWLTVCAVCIAVIKCSSIVSGLVMYKHFVSEHTVMNKISGMLLFIIPLCLGLLPRQPVMILVIVTCVLSIFAAIQEGHYIRTGKEIR